MPNDLAAVTDTTLTNVSKKVIKRAAPASNYAGHSKFASELLSDASTRSSEKVERLAILGPCTALCKTSPRLPALHLHLGLKLWVLTGAFGPSVGFAM
jgi:hypothetical protein